MPMDNFYSFLKSAGRLLFMVKYDADMHSQLNSSTFKPFIKKETDTHHLFSGKLKLIFSF